MQRIFINSLLRFLVILITIGGNYLFGQDKSEISYSISAKIDAQQKLIESKAKISFPKSLLGKEQKIYLKLAISAGSNNERVKPQIKRITDAKGTEIKVESEANGLILAFTLPPNDNSTNEITIEYTVPFSEDDFKNLGYYLYPSHGDSNYWYPVLLDEKKQNIRFANYKVGLTYPKNYGVLTSGQSMGQYIYHPSLVTEHFTADYIEGFSLALGENYQLQTVEKDGIQVTAFSSLELKSKFLEIAQQAADAAAWYQKIYGFFPVTNIGLVSGYKTASGGFPMPNIFMIHQGRLYSEFTQLMTAHELGHYYWGLYVFSDQEFLDWMMLAQGIWIDRLYLAEKNGRTLEAQWRGFNQELFNRFEGFRVADIANYDQRLDLNPAEARALKYDYNTYIRHDKGAIGVYLQALLLGKEKFLALQKRILSEYRYRPFSEADFIRLLTEFGSQNAEEFFKVWRKGDARLAFRISNVERVESDKNIFRYKITVRRTGNVPYPVEIEVQETNGKKNRFTVSGQNLTEVIETTLNSAISTVSLDPDGILPIWNSANVEIQAINIRAMFRAEAGEAAVVLATEYLKRNPNDELTRSMLIDELIKTGRLSEAKQFMEGRKTDSCNDYGSCLSLINLAFVLVEEGKKNEAETILSRIGKTVGDYGLLRRWESVKAKLKR